MGMITVITSDSPSSCNQISKEQCIEAKKCIRSWISHFFVISGCEEIRSDRRVHWCGSPVRQIPVVEVEKLADCDSDCCGEYRQCVYGAGSVLAQSKFRRGQVSWEASEVEECRDVETVKLLKLNGAREGFGSRTIYDLSRACGIPSRSTANASS